MDNTNTVTNNSGFFKDERGIIKDILQEDINSVTIITFNNAVRGNHYHKKTTQWDYVLEGDFVFFSDEFKEGKRIKMGDLIKIPPEMPHAYVGDGVLISMCKGPRAGEDYEKDTYRLEKKLV